MEKPETIHLRRATSVIILSFNVLGSFPHEKEGPVSATVDDLGV